MQADLDALAWDVSEHLSDLAVAIPGEPPLLSAPFQSEADSHWKSLRTIIREARMNGYASVNADNAMLYVAFYNRSGVTEVDIKREELPRDVIASGILSETDRDRDAILVNQIPPDDGRGHNVFLPFYLYPIQRWALSDLLHGRLVLVVLVNPGRIMEALERDGFLVRDADHGNYRPQKSFVISCELQTAGCDDKYWMELHNFSFHIQEIVQEFKSVDYIVEVARATRREAQNALLQQASAASQAQSQGA
jgi:hypothetical protein